MKKSFALMLSVIILVSVGCHKSQSGDAAGTQGAKFQSAALASIIAAHPRLKSSDLAFVNMTNVVTHGGAEVIQVKYVLSTRHGIQTGERSTIDTTTFLVTISPSGKVEHVSELNPPSMTISR